jgi:hypothetical protein
VSTISLPPFWLRGYAKKANKTLKKEIDGIAK